MGQLKERFPMAEPPMISPAAQAVAASGSSKGAPLFVAADPGKYTLNGWGQTEADFRLKPLGGDASTGG